jgi:hypothetical protein
MGLTPVAMDVVDPACPGCGEETASQSGGRPDRKSAACAQTATATFTAGLLGLTLLRIAQRLARLRSWCLRRGLCSVGRGGRGAALLCGG